MKFEDPNLEAYYKKFYSVLPQETIEYDPITLQEQTVEGISEQVEKYLRGYYDKSIADRRKQTTVNNTGIDVDAASRGMTASTWLTDAKNRQYQAEAADIANLNSDYNSKLAETVYNQYQNYLNQKLEVDTRNRENQIEVDEWNSQVRVAMEQLAYQRALEELQRHQLAEADTGSGGGGGGGSRKGGGGAGSWYYVKDKETGKVTRQRLTKEEAKKAVRAPGSVVIVDIKPTAATSTGSSGTGSSSTAPKATGASGSGSSGSKGSSGVTGPSLSPKAISTTLLR